MAEKTNDYVTSLIVDFPSAEYRAQRVFSKIQQISREIRDLQILDVGCGLGQLLLKLELDGFSHLHGVDNSEQAVQTLRKKSQNLSVTFLNIDQEPLPYASDSMDIAVCLEVFEHLYDPVAALSEIVRVLKPGGQAILSVPNEYRITQRIKFALGKSISSPFRRGGHIKFFNRSQMVEFVGKEMIVCSFEGVGNPRVRRFPFLTRWFPGLFAKWFYVHAKKSEA